VKLSSFQKETSSTQIKVDDVGYVLIMIGLLIDIVLD